MGVMSFPIVVGLPQDRPSQELSLRYLEPRRWIAIQWHVGSGCILESAMIWVLPAAFPARTTTCSPVLLVQMPADTFTCGAIRTSVPRT